MSVHTQNNAHVLDHPLVSHKLAILRARETPPHHFRRDSARTILAAGLSGIAEIAGDTGPEVETPLERMTA